MLVRHHRRRTAGYHFAPLAVNMLPRSFQISNLKIYLWHPPRRHALAPAMYGSSFMLIDWVLIGFVIVFSVFAPPFGWTGIVRRTHTGPINSKAPTYPTAPDHLPHNTWSHGQCHPPIDPKAPTTQAHVVPADRVRHPPAAEHTLQHSSAAVRWRSDPRPASPTSPCTRRPCLTEARATGTPQTGRICCTQARTSVGSREEGLNVWSKVVEACMCGRSEV